MATEAASAACVAAQAIRTPRLGAASRTALAVGLHDLRTSGSNRRRAECLCSRSRQSCLCADCPMMHSRGLTFDMSGGPRARSGPWDVRSMEGLGVMYRVEAFDHTAVTNPRTA